MRVWPIAVIVLASAGCRGRAGDDRAPCEAPPSAGVQPNEHVQLLMKGLHFHATDTVTMDIAHLRGELLPTREGRPPDTEDATSYVIRLDSARISIPEKSIANDFRDYVLAGTGAPIQGLTVSASTDGLRMKGELSPGVPFDIRATVEKGDDGLIHVKTRELKTAGIGVRGLSAKTDLTLERIIGSHADRGVTVKDNDMVIDPKLGFPPPHLDGPLESVTLVDGAIELAFGRSKKLSSAGKAALPPLDAKHFIQHFKGTLANGKAVVHGADQRLLDADPGDPFDYSQPLFSKVQLPASQIHVSPKGETTTIRVPDLDDVERTTERENVRGED